MPIYEYKCNDCGVHLEERQGVGDEPLIKCDSCGGRLEKQWSLSGFQFKGQGWYVTDYSNSKGKDATGGNSSAKEKTSSAESTSDASPASNESKSETKSETVAKKD